MPPPDVAVIGGGILGTATATFLAEAGLSVRLYERAGIAAGASGRNSGIVQHPFDPVLADLYRRSVTEYGDLADRSAGGFSWPAAPAGLLYVGRDDAAARAEAQRWTEAWPATRAAVLEGSTLRALEPALAPDLIACRLEIGYPVQPAAATEAFAERARAAGVEIRTGAGVVRPGVRRGRAIGVVGGDPDGRVQPAGGVVVAAGPWTADLVAPDGGWRPIRAVWGVVAAVGLAAPPRHGLEAIDIEIEPEAVNRGASAASAATGERPSDAGVAFSLIPSAAGTSALGSTFLADEPVSADWVENLRRVGARYVPAVGDSAVRGLRHCARPVSRDGRPLIGPVPGIAGLWVAAGHGPWGISTGPGSARLLAEAILGGSAAAALPGGLAVGRFGGPTGQRQESASNR